MVEEGEVVKIELEGTKSKTKKEKKYRGPPPRRDLVRSPCKDKEWKGNGKGE